MKSFIGAVPYLIEQGYVLKAWTSTIDEDIAPNFSIQFIKKSNLPGFLKDVSYFFQFNGKGFLQYFTRKDKDVDIVLTTGGYYLGGDISILHFFNPSWWKIQKKIHPSSWRFKIQKILGVTGIIFDSLQVWNPFCQKIVTVSDSIADDIRNYCLNKEKAAKVSVLPNAVDTKKFNVANRKSLRPHLRGELGYSDSDAVYIFASQGHHRRKGFWLAVDAVSCARNKDSKDHKLLVLGGTLKTLEKIRREIDILYPDASDWIQFTGMTDRMLDYFSAGDAFLFPSYFEAFSLVEIEAAAVGLPLILTRHHGSEMILKEGVNGQFTSFNTEEIADVLVDFKKKGLPDFEPSIGRALTPEQYQEQFNALIKKELKE